MAILYEIQESGFADRLMSGIVVTGGCAQTANLGNLIYDLSGYRVRTGYPKHVFSFEGCEGITDTSASTSLGLIMAAKEDQTINCAVAKDVYVQEAETTVPDKVEKEKEQEQGDKTLLEFETVEPVKQPQTPKPQKADKKGGKVKWNLKDFFGTLYDSVHNELDEIEKEEA